MHKKASYRDTDKLNDLICDNPSMLLVLSRFGLRLGFGDTNIGEACRQHQVDTTTFLTVVNFLIEGRNMPLDEESLQSLSAEALISYLHNAHDYFLRFRLPLLRRKLTEAITGDCPADVAFIITRFYDEYTEEVNKHMMYEEKTVFPYVRNLVKGKKDTRYNISIFSKRHDQIELKITELKNLLLKYYPGPGSHQLNNVLFDIFATEQDLATHNLIEDHLFTPAIRTLEKHTPAP